METAKDLVKTESNSIALPTIEEQEQYWQISVKAYKSGLLPSTVKSPEAAFIIGLKGRDIGVALTTAWEHIHVVKGKPGCSSELMLAEIYKQFPKAKIKFLQHDNKGCKIRASRGTGDEADEFEFTMEDAKRAKLTAKDNWAMYPKAMCRARAISEMKRAKFPEVLMGISYSKEEVQDMEEPRNVTPQEEQPEQPKTDPSKPRSVMSEVVDEEPKEENKQESSGSGGESQTEIVPPSDTAEVPNEAAPIVRKKLGEDIHELLKKLNISTQAFCNDVQVKYQKDPGKLDIEEMTEIRDEMKAIVEAGNY